MSENYSSKHGRWQRLSESLPAELRGQVSLRNVEVVAAQAEALARPYPPSEMDVNKLFEELRRAGQRSLGPPAIGDGLYPSNDAGQTS